MRSLTLDVHHGIVEIKLCAITHVLADLYLTVCMIVGLF